VDEIERAMNSESRAVATRASEGRVRLLIQRLGALLTGGGTLFWAWVQCGPEPPVRVTALMAAAGALALWVRWPRVRAAAAVFLFGLASWWLSGFYDAHADWPVPIGRLQTIPGGPLLLTASVFAVLFLHIPFVARVPWSTPRRRQGAVTVALALATLVAADLFFLPEWFGRFRRLKFHPFLTEDAPDSYKYAHAQERYVYDSPRRLRFAQRKPPNTIRIVLLGASTMAGAANATERAPGSRLLDHLRQAQPDQAFEVVTLAEPGTFQLQELIDAAVTLPHWDPDLVVSWNGFNEVWFGEEENRYEGMPGGAFDVEVSVDASGVDAWLYTHSFFGAHLLRRRRQALSARYGLQERDEYEPPRYYAYLQREAELLARAGIRYASSFCPNVAEKHPRSPEEERQEVDLGALALRVAERRRRGSAIVRAAGQISYDAMESLNGTADTLFVDLCHLNDEGADRAARDLARRVPEWLRAPRPAP
jgi:hypothetical protein